MVSGDYGMVDKGFKIHDLAPQGVSINIPPFLLEPHQGSVLRPDSICLMENIYFRVRIGICLSDIIRIFNFVYMSPEPVFMLNVQFRG